MTTDPRALARERMAGLLEGARLAVERVQTADSSVAGTALFGATWSVSLAAGFLEAFAILDPGSAEAMLAEFAAVATLTERLHLRGEAEVAASTEPEVVAGRRRRRRKTDYMPRVMVRRVLPDRRLEVRRRLNDRRRAASA